METSQTNYLAAHLKTLEQKKRERKRKKKEKKRNYTQNEYMLINNQTQAETNTIQYRESMKSWFFEKKSIRLINSYPN